MDDKALSEVPAGWLGLPIIAAVARMLCRELTLQDEYLRLENKILKSKIQGRVRHGLPEFACALSASDAACAFSSPHLEHSWHHRSSDGSFVSTDATRL